MEPQADDSPKPPVTKYPNQNHNKTATYIESIVGAIIHAVNSRSLDPIEDPVYSAVAEDFSAAPAPPAPAKKVCLSEYLSNVRTKVKEYPDYRINILTMDSVTDEDAGTGIVLMNEELEGIPRGVTRHAASIWRFQVDPVSRAWQLRSLQVEQGGFAEGL